jgi:hypothetical protein
MVRRTQLRYALLILFAVTTPVAATALELTVAGDHRQIEDYFIPLPPGVDEGSIRMLVVGDGPIDLVTPAPAFVRESAAAFSTVFPWNWTGPRQALFRDSLGDTATVVVFPQTPWRYDPAATLVPLVTITTDSTGLWDPATGIYVVGDAVNFDQRGGAWEREARFRFYEPGRGLVVDEPIGLRIHGGFSRYYHQKGLRIYFDDYGLADQVVYPFFTAGPGTFRRLICRANRFDSVAINTNLAEGLMGDLGHAYSRQRFVAVFLNQEYWGAYNLRERLDDEFFEHTWQLAAKGDWNFIKDGDTEEGSADGWWSFLASFGQVTDPTDPVWFDGVRRTLDLASYIDWQLINLYLVPGDNGFAWNLALYQPGDHPWRLVMWDEDLLMNSLDTAAETFKFFTADGPDAWARWQAPSDDRPWTTEQQEWLTMFRTLLGNPDFRALFHSRLDHLVATELNPDAMIARLDALATEQMPEIPGHAARWDGFRTEWYQQYLVRTRQWLRDRHPLFLAQAAAFLSEWPAPAWPGNYDGLVINEIMPVNESTIADESGDFDGWIELYNASALPINLTGVGLSSAVSGRGRWEFPAVMIRPDEHLVVWLDGQRAEGPLHLSGLLYPAGDTLWLTSPLQDGARELDRHTYGPVAADVSVGRIRDGLPDWIVQATPSPGALNDGPVIPPRPVPNAPELHDNYPNPFNGGTTLVFGLAQPGRVRIRVHDLRGRLVATLLDEQRGEGYDQVTWAGTDDGGRMLPSGVYAARLEASGTVVTRTMTLVR